MDRTSAGLLRPILPGRNTTQRSSSPSSTVRQQQISPLSQGQIVLPRRALTTAACHRCRQGKAKCDGHRPRCGRCRNKGFDCAYDRAPNETPTVALRREHEFLKHEYVKVKSANDALQKIFELLRTRPPDDTTLMLSLIQEGVDPDDILRQITEGDLLLQMQLRPEANFRYQFPWRAQMPAYIQKSMNPYLNAPLHDATFGNPANFQLVKRRQSVIGSQYLMPLSAARIVDDRLDSIKPSLYTNVSNNDRLMRKMLHEFFLFGYDWACVFQVNDFLDDMLAQEHDFCSPLLVNAILAYSTHCTSTLPGRARYWDSDTLGYRFLAEARRMWDVEFGARNPTLPSLQGGILLYLLYMLHGMDKVALIFNKELFHCIEALGLHARSIPGEDYRYRRSRGISVWFWFWMQSSVSYHYKEFPPMSSVPATPFPNPDLEPEFYGDLYLQYPLGQTLQPMHFGWSFHKSVHYGVLMHRYATRRFSAQGKPNINDIQDFASGLRTWYQTLPDVLQPQNIVLPMHFKAHIHWLQMAIEVQDLLANANLPPLDMFSAIPSTSPESKAVLQAAFETLTRIQYLRHGSETCNSLSIQNLNILAFGAIKSLTSLNAARLAGQDIPQVDFDDARSTLILAAKGLSDQAKNWYICQSILEVVADATAPDDVELLERFAQVKINDVNSHVQREHVAVEYPLGIAKPDEVSVDHRKLGNALKMRRVRSASRSQSGSSTAATPGARV